MLIMNNFIAEIGIQLNLVQYNSSGIISVRSCTYTNSQHSCDDLHDK